MLTSVWSFRSLLRNSRNKHQITLSWAHKQFATLVNTLFYNSTTFTEFIYIYNESTHLIEIHDSAFKPMVDCTATNSAITMTS